MDFRGYLDFLALDKFMKMLVTYLAGGEKPCFSQLIQLNFEKKNQVEESNMRLGSFQFSWVGNDSI